MDWCSHYNDALQICANLDAYTIKTKALGEEPKGPYKHIASAQERKEVTTTSKQSITLL